MSDGLKALNPPSVAAPGGPYSQAVLAPSGGRWLHVSGQVGVRPDGSIPEHFEGQAEVCWQNLVALLSEAGMGVQDLVKVSTFLTDAAQVARLGPVRAKFLGDARPASTLVVVAALARPQWQVEVEAIAWKA
ncbi:RidA family protein [Ramlibacter rhizophilus]|uniref:RidA family protein n=1 Tax=Ramlibacter rhizophilus TaxID=1781167 RepID=A0A4Z0C3B2_9BURK|nr:RidA family protein [Ramlibacter rhizophilus]TFZ04689.1 RidA family protein [Ramlibacter rhizophilus]